MEHLMKQNICLSNTLAHILLVCVTKTYSVPIMLQNSKCQVVNFSSDLTYSLRCDIHNYRWIWVVVFSGSTDYRSCDTHAKLNCWYSKTEQSLFSSQQPWHIINAWYNHYLPGIQRICPKC